MILNEKVKSIVDLEIYGFIDYFTSDDTERERMKIVADNYMKEVFEYEPDRINELEEKAWMNMSGEEVVSNLNDEEIEEYEKLMNEEDGNE